MSGKRISSDIGSVRWYTWQEQEQELTVRAKVCLTQGVEDVHAGTDTRGDPRFTELSDVEELGRTVVLGLKCVGAASEEL